MVPIFCITDSYGFDSAGVKTPADYMEALRAGGQSLIEVNYLLADTNCEIKSGRNVVRPDCKVSYFFFDLRLDLAATFFAGFALTFATGLLAGFRFTFAFATDFPVVLFFGAVFLVEADDRACFARSARMISS